MEAKPEVVSSPLPLLSVHFKQLDCFVLFGLTRHNLHPQGQTSVILLLDSWQKKKQTFSGFKSSSRLQHAVGGVPELEMETNPVWNGPPGQSTRSVLKENISHTQKSPVSPVSAEEKAYMLLPQVAVDSTSIYCLLVIFFSIMR